MAAKGAPSELAATARKPVGQRVDLVAVAHPHLVASRPRLHSPSNSAQLPAISMKARPNSPAVGRRDLAAELVRHHLLAVADAEHRQARVEQIAAGRAGCRLTSPRRAPPDRMMPVGLQPRERLGGAAERRDLGIDAGLAHAAGDELGHLAAEIDDQDGFGRLPVHAREVSTACCCPDKGPAV